MPNKKKTVTKTETAKAAEPKAAPRESLLGRPAFPANVIPNTDPALENPAGAVELQVPNTKPAKAGSPTITLMNPTPTAAASTSPNTKRG